MSYTTRPLSDRTWLRPQSKRKDSRFDSTWTSTLQLLDREVGSLDGRDLVIEVDVPESQIKNDGTLYARAQATSPAVVVAFESKHGPMLYRADALTTRYSDQGPAWQHNVRAVALTLEALRAVDRYGATDTGQQYTGFKALGPGTMPASHMTRDDAVAVLASYVDVPPEHLNLEPESLRHVWSRARRAAHPDRHAGDRTEWVSHPDRHAGDRTEWDVVEQAAAALGVTR